MTATTTRQPWSRHIRYPHWQRDNPAILATFAALDAAKALTGSHFFGGRWENQYAPRAAVPALEPVLHYAQRCAADVMQQPPAALRIGFWFNATHPGQSTAPHTHDDFDECLSGVYYVRTPPDSGDLRLGEAAIRLRPREGGLVLFDPALIHYVDTHRGQGMRLSVGMNFGPADGGWPA